MPPFCPVAHHHGTAFNLSCKINRFLLEYWEAVAG